ncbi:polyhydroxyalkanoate depolymerase [Cognatazoarcus halotolerans]|uniref:polyhydroxyalkanoate depolymerase n=1 Tax=Cognatazoarcus halotolerans TaxID=2686016 RepID=UPI001356F8BD|nr:polyhydroxyalkanoate depolymerase [Cognatazoarcus halotolerans]MBX3680768.1 polyhydroxyalkanoate depolymerase [Rhodocyclaceae bacterium]MCB1901089.1 polyhydroxyalkanoate depolymerase [Rhodocyclaceae bacterium]MCP5308902.1 polyhydroxyalkanoate depolymerase [Zoogloeaceae bacterium]
MRYTMLDLTRSAAAPMEAVLSSTIDVLSSRYNPLARTTLGRVPIAALESVARMIKPYHKQAFDYGSFEADGETITIVEKVALKKPFCHLVHFERVGKGKAPKVLFVAAMSGHHATLSKETFRAFLPDHDVYVTDWLDARDIPLSAGRFGFEDYVGYLIEFIQLLGPDVHVIGLCQATVQALCATAIMSGRQDPCRPKTLSLLAGPIDITVNPNTLTRYASHINLGFLKALAVHKVPSGYAGAGREVYPGHLQIGAFMSMNPGNHLKKHWNFFKDVARGNEEAANRHREFYDEYMTVMDATAEFYLETLERVFLTPQLPRGEMHYRGEPVDCGAITDTALFTLEGERDDMVALGVTEAAHRLCPNLPEALHRHHVQAGVGHYGIFNGSIYRTEIAPMIKSFIRSGGRP